MATNQKSPPIILDAGGARAASVFLGLLLAKEARLGGVTDVYLAANDPVTARRSAGDWAQVVKPDGTPWVFPLDVLRAFVNGIYSGEEQVPAASAAWDTALRRQGSLHPATVLSGDADGSAVMLRVRCTIQRQQMGVGLGIVVRSLSQSAPNIADLGLPDALRHEILRMGHGLIVVTGPTGSGKTTTLSSFLQAINTDRASHILTIEDPIEYELDRVRSVITQREVGIDVPNFAQGIKDALRFVPDVILVGETRDADTMRACVRAAESGHLVMTSMHAPTTTGAIIKMRALLDDADRSALAGSLQMVMAQALVRDVTGRNVLLYEVMPGGDRAVQQLVATGDMKDAEALRSKVATRQIRGAYNWQQRLRELVRDERLLPERAAAMAQTREEREEFLQAKGKLTQAV